MKTKIIPLLVFVAFPFLILGQNNFDKYFKEQSLRIEYFIKGNIDSESVRLKGFKKDPFWGGTKVNLIDSFLYGTYRLHVYDKASGKLIYTSGFCDMFEEYRTTSKGKTEIKEFEEAFVIPFPKKAVVVKLFLRDKEYKPNLILNLEFSSDTIKFQENMYAGIDTINLFYSGASATNVDIAILAEGYTKDEMEKFKKDATNFVKNMFSYHPYENYKKNINIWGVISPSIENGTDIPQNALLKETILNSSFNTFESERYLLTESYFTVKDIASNVPYDNIFILVNSSKYGGGGIYNFYSIATSDNKYASFLQNHEFGHAFAGLADEYEGNVSYENFFSIEVEPWQPNITTLVDFEKKWKDLIDKKTKIPTPKINKNENKIGVYEGGGYLSEGVYRPFMDCTMRSISENNFCPICQRAISQMIEFYCK